MGQDNRPVIGDILLHDNGTYYRVLMYGVSTEDRKTMVVCENLKSKTVWVIPLTKVLNGDFIIAINGESLQS